jgi:FkbM family methyltransferase
VPPSATVYPPIRPLRGAGLLRAVNRVVPLGRKLHPLLALFNPPTGLVSVPFEGRDVVHPIAWRKPATALLLAGRHYVPEVQLLPPILAGLQHGALVDVGANIGFYPLIFRNYSALPIIAFEPQPLLFRLLELCVQHNRLADVTLHNVACGQSRGEVPFSIGLNGEVATGDLSGRLTTTAELDFERAIANTQAGRDVVMVPVTTLDEALAGTEVALLKIDCEGFEHQILLGAQKLIETQRPILFLEVHPLGLERFDSSVSAVSELLAPRYEFECWDFSRVRFRPKLVRSFLKHRPTSAHRFADVNEMLAAAATAPRPTQLYLVARPKK